VGFFTGRLAARMVSDAFVFSFFFPVFFFPPFFFVVFAFG
jgi:hypothetical protein